MTAPQTDFGYTGQRNEAYTDLMDYRSRWYDGWLGRFIQPDSIVPGAGNSQSFNRYSYVLNSPIVFNDPTGHMQANDGYTQNYGRCDKGDTSCNWIGNTPGKDPGYIDDVHDRHKCKIVCIGSNSSKEIPEIRPNGCNGMPFCANPQMPRLPSITDIRGFLGNFDISPNGTIPTDGNFLQAYTKSREAWFATHPLAIDNGLISEIYNVGDFVIGFGIPLGATAINFGIDQITNTGPYSVLPPRSGTLAQKVTSGIFTLVIVGVLIAIPK